MFALFKATGKKGKKELMSYLNDVGKQIYDSEYNRCLEIAMSYNDSVVNIFCDWWNGKCVSTKEYESQYSKQDLEDVGGIILTTISRGFG